MCSPKYSYNFYTGIVFQKFYIKPIKLSLPDLRVYGNDLFTLSAIHKTYQCCDKGNHNKGKNSNHDYAIAPIYQGN